MALLKADRECHLKYSRQCCNRLLSRNFLTHRQRGVKEWEKLNSLHAHTDLNPECGSIAVFSKFPTNNIKRMPSHVI